MKTVYLACIYLPLPTISMSSKRQKLYLSYNQNPGFHGTMCAPQDHVLRVNITLAQNGSHQRFSMLCCQWTVAKFHIGPLFLVPDLS